MAFDESGNIILCQHGDRRLAFIQNISSKDPKFTTVIDNYEGKRFNSPNDLAISKTGDIYFTDPPYGFKNFSNKYREINFNGVYKYSKDGEVFLISSNMLSLIHISEPTRPLYISYAVFCLKKKKKK